MDKAQKGIICVSFKGNLTLFRICWPILNKIFWNTMQKQIDLDFKIKSFFFQTILNCWNMTLNLSKEAGRTSSNPIQIDVYHGHHCCPPNVQPCQAISSHFQPFQPFPTISGLSSHLQPFQTFTAGWFHIKAARKTLFFLDFD